MSTDSSTPARVQVDEKIRQPRSLLADDPITWTNGAVEAYVVQAVPHIQTLHGQSLLRETNCKRDEPCPGTSQHAIEGVRLDRDEALHAVARHYSHANWSICRFLHHASPQYAVDLIFEIDAHVHGAPAPFFPDSDYYAPSIGTAVFVGRLIFEYLVHVLSVDPAYITTCVTRMGARVTVDWRAFGPRRLHQVLAVVRHVECQLFPEGFLEKLSARLTGAMSTQVRRCQRRLEAVLERPLEDLPPFKCSVTIDGGIYRASETASRSSATAGDFRGPFIRPPGTLHSASSDVAMWFRVTPVPHDRFLPRNARWLSRVSRSGTRSDLAAFKEPALFTVPWPETRWRSGDAKIEGDGSRPRLAPADKLIELFDRWETLDVPEAARSEIAAQQRRTGSRGAATAATVEITREIVDAVVAAAMLKKVRSRRGKYTFECPYCAARGSKNNATIFHETGVFNCFSDKCEGSKSLYEFAKDRGISQLVPFKRSSSSLVRRVLRRDLPVHQVPTWEDIATVERTIFGDVHQARQGMKVSLQRLLDHRDWQILIVRGPTGVGKTTTVLETLSEVGAIVRGAVPRDESRQPFIDALGAKPIDGRRTGENGNCRNPKVDVIKDLGLPFHLVCGKSCPHFAGCEYLGQFDDVGDVSLVLNHQHLPMLNMARFQNGGAYLVVDESPILAALGGAEVSQKDVGRFRVGVETTSPAWEEGADDVSLSDDLHVSRRVGVTPALDRLIAWLEEALTLESMSTFDGDLAADLSLAKHWTSDGRLVELLAEIDDSDLEAHEAEVLASAKAHLGDPSKPRPPKNVMRQLVDGLRTLCASAAVELSRPLSIYAVRGDRAWSVRLSHRRELLHNAARYGSDVAPHRTIILSSTITPTQFLAAFGDRAGVHVLEPVVESRERRVLVADHQFGTRGLLGSKPKHVAARRKLFETATALIKRERARTGLPVIVGGRASVLNSFLDSLLGKRLPDRLRMPFSTERSQRMEELRALTLPHGVLCAYAGGVSGSNAFCVEEGAVKRFSRSFVMLGGIIPPLGQVEANMRGLLAGFPFEERVAADGFEFVLPVTDRSVDWGVVPRTVPIPGTECGEGEAVTVQVAQNAIGFADPYASELLHHSYEGEAAQMIGRMRGSIPDPVDPTITPTVWILAHLVIPGMEMDEVMSLADLREDLGLEGDPKKPRGPKRTSRPEILNNRVRNKGRFATIEWLIKGLGSTKERYGDGTMSPLQGLVVHVQGVWQEAGLEWTEREQEAAIAAAKPFFET